MDPPLPPNTRLVVKQPTDFLKFSGEQELSASAFGRQLLAATRAIRAVHQNRGKTWAWTCPICESDFSLSDVSPTEPESRNAAKLGDGHDHPSYCHNCLHSWIKAKLDDNAPEIRCLNEKCTTMLDYVFLRTRIPAPLFRRWESLRLMAALAVMPDLRYCPTCSEPAWLAPGCGEAECPVCNFNFCPTCLLPKHAAIRCSAAVFEQDPEVQKKFYQERLCQDWKIKHTKKCPKCQVAIEKNDGCSHMTCQACKYQWCWICSGKYQGKYVTGAAATGSQCPCPSPGLPPPP